MNKVPTLAIINKAIKENPVLNGCSWKKIKNVIYSQIPKKKKAIYWQIILTYPGMRKCSYFIYFEYFQSIIV